MFSHPEEPQVTDDAPDAASRSALVAVGALGPFFAVDVVAAGPLWRPIAELGRPDVLRERVGAARQTIASGSGLAPGEVEERVVASIVFLGWAARLVSPALGCAVLTSSVPAMSGARWRAGVSSPMPLALPSATFSAADGAAQLAELVYRQAVHSVVAPLLDAVAGTFSVSRTVLWGNVASAVAGAAALIGAALIGAGPAGAGPAGAGLAGAGLAGAERPDLADASCEQITGTLLRLGPLAGKGRFTRAEQHARPRPASRRQFVRTTCCLFYRIPGAGTCGDCVLNRR